MKTLSLVTILAVSTPLFAEDEHREHGAHQHGHANLNLAWSGHEVEIELRSPAMNIVGFEHKVKSEADHQAVENAVATLKQPLALISPTASADCELEKVEVDSELLGEHEDEHGHDDHDEHADAHGHDDHDDHNDAHAHDKHDSHDDEHKDHAKAEAHEHEHEHDHAEHAEQHSDFEVTIGYHCDAPGKLAAFDLRGLFKAFPGIEELDVQWISDRSQSSAELNAKRTLIRLQ